MIADPHELQRLRYVPDQDLLSRDFRDHASYEEQLRWSHNRAMHGAFGVRYGLQVTLDSSVLTKPRVKVEGGLAYDAFGRELILQRPATAPAPQRAPEDATLVLVLRYRDEGGARAAGNLAGAGCGAPAPAAAELAWLPAWRLRPLDGVPLGRLFQRGGAVRLDPDFRQPMARPLAKPRLGHGRTVAGATAWQLWQVDAGVAGQAQRVVLGLQVAIDTHAAGFTQPPCYFAWLQGGIVSEDATGVLRRFLQPLLCHLAEQTLTGFRFRVVPFGLSTVGKGNFLLAAARRQLAVCWLGIQMRTDDLPEVIHGHP
jgi:hypothetical protein